MKSARNFNFFVLDKQCCMVETIKNTITEGHGTNEPSNIEPAPRQQQKIVVKCLWMLWFTQFTVTQFNGKVQVQ